MYSLGTAYDMNDLLYNNISPRLQMAELDSTTINIQIQKSIAKCSIACMKFLNKIYNRNIPGNCERNILHYVLEYTMPTRRSDYRAFRLSGPELPGYRTVGPSDWSSD